MIIRQATVEDAAAIMVLHERSVRGLCSADYTPEQLDLWLGSITLEKHQKRLKLHKSFIAEIDSKTIGYVRWNPETNELCSIFVDPGFVRRGIGTKLMMTESRDALSYGVRVLWLDASLTAVPFYIADGWDIVEKGMHGPLECVRMTKTIHHDCASS